MARGNKLSLAVIFVVSLFAHSRPILAQILIEDPSKGVADAPVEPPAKPKVGQGAASDYFKKRDQRHEQTRDPSALGARVLMLHLGNFINDKAYRWGSKNRVEDPGQANIGVTYRIGEWKSSMDLFFRAEVISYKIDDERPVKLSVMPIVAFPDSRSNFPLYFGAGAGAGIFFQQIGDESDLSFDYALLVGARFPEMFDNGGLFLETGLKGHVHLVSSGQQDGVFLAFGYMFSF